MPATEACEVLVAVAQHDSPEFHRQSRQYFQVLCLAFLPPHPPLLPAPGTSNRPLEQSPVIPSARVGDRGTLLPSLPKPSWFCLGEGTECDAGQPGASVPVDL